jgi:nucleotide-binding universal stress UspA family protein
MTGIICAIRGGPSSNPTIERAISLAKEEDLALTFIYVVNLDFLTHTTSTRVHTIERELQNMGEFILLNAQAKAEKQDVQAEGVVRRGSLADEIIDLSHEIEATYVVLGQTKGREEIDTFTHDRFSKFVERIEDEGNVKAILVETELDNNSE